MGPTCQRDLDQPLGGSQLGGTSSVHGCHNPNPQKGVDQGSHDLL